MHRLSILTAALALAVIAGPRPAAAHEKGVLTPATRELPAGDTVALAGERFTRSAALRLELVGPRGRIALGEVRTDSAGRFAMRVAVPAGTTPGSYRLVAVASDGDEVATVDVAVRPAPPPGEAVVAPGPMEEPTDEPLALDRARSGLVTGGTVLLAAVAIVSGIALLRRRA